ncbi:MAG TPA: hypothetical protein VHM24_10145, partial [Gemmatimonadaceae bacterium]|nr:hypothetical protein [Gemmatimonadaceae bacterium]
MISVAEASGRILERIQALSSDRVPTGDAAGRVLAASLVAPITSPPWDNSSMDGYAVRGADLASDTAPRLHVVDTVAAGSFPSRRVERGEAIRIMTGAPVPGGADSVIRHEDTDNGREAVTILNKRDIG